MFHKFLFVGLGGSGGKTLRYLRHELSTWLNAVGWEGPFPAAWQMLHIDTPTAQDGTEIKDVPMLPASNYLGLVMTGVDFRTVSTRITQSSPENVWQDLAGWRVDPTYLQVPITTGAGQFRAVGRTIGLAYADKILEALHQAWSRLSAASTGAELAEIHQRAYGKQATTPPDPVVVVVSSLAGGTGAGLLLDACDLLRQLPGRAGHNSFGVLYASDVFQELGDMATAGVQPNALAALCELMNGYWLTENHPRVSAIFEAAGAPVPIGRSGPAFPFLVGAQNTKGVSFGNQREVYAMMGRALRGWAADPTIQIQLVEYTMANWQSNADGNTVKADVVMRDHPPIFEAFGYAEVTLGTERFSLYAAQRLARLAAIWLLHGHHRRALENDPNEKREPDEIADDLAADELVRFLVAVGLHERGDTNNQVIDDLAPPESEAWLRRAASTIEGDVTTGIKALPAQGWVDRISEMVPGFADQFMRDYDDGVRERARVWTEAMPDRFVDCVLDIVSRHGLDVAHRLLQRVGEELLAVCGELEDEANEYLRWSSDARSAIASKLQASGNIPPTNSQVGDAVWEGLWVAGHYRSEAKRREIAQVLMNQFATDVVRPFTRALAHARHDLYLHGFQGDGVEDPIVDNWPDAQVPTSMRPPKNEFLIFALDDFPDRFDRLIGRSARSDIPGEQIPEARRSVITGDFFDASDYGPGPVAAVSVTTAWRPDPSAFAGGVEPRAAAQFTVHMSPEALLSRSRAWIERPGSAFQRFLAQDLRSYLDEDPTLEPGELQARRSNLRRALTSALDAAEPLVRLDMSLLPLLHRKADIPRRAIPSTIPFKDHPVGEGVSEILASALGSTTAADAVAGFTTARNVTSISISSTLGAAHDPLVFGSIMDPVVKGWNAAKQSPPARTNFWSNRRARTIEEFTPASHEVISAMTRGWFTGLMLGRIDRDRRSVARGGGQAYFPQPLLRDVASARDLLPAVLESLGLAYAEVSQRETLDPLDAYLELRDLGCQPGLNTYRAAHIYEHPNAALATWIRSGDTGPVLVKPVVTEHAKEDLDDALPSERRAAAVALLDSVRHDYESRIDEYRRQSRIDPASLGPNNAIWPGMWNTINRALTDLNTALMRMELDDQGALM